MNMYRSKSIKRLDYRLSDLIENNNSKVLATANIQLFISTPELDKWFKSSTGTLCFLRDLNNKNVYYFRLYSLMQGQLWEQETSCPFIYNKLSHVFHYLTINKFNYGFRFICEDEAERFFSAITKLTENEACCVESNEFKRKLSANPLGSIASAAAAVATRTVVACSTNSSSTNTLSNYSTGSTSSRRAIHSGSIRAAAKNVSSPDSKRSSRQSRKQTRSPEPKRKIEKRDISCPFRCCPYKDLNYVIPPNDLAYNIEKNDQTQKANNHYEKSGKLHQRAFNSFLKRRYSSASQKRQSITSIQSTCTTSDNISNETKKTSPSSTCSISTSPSSINSKVSHLIKQNNSETKISDINQFNNNLTDISNKNENENDEMGIIREILTRHNVPIDKKFIKCFRVYICENYGSIDGFNKALELDSELKKFNLFVADYSISINSSAQKTPDNYIRNNQNYETKWKTPNNNNNNNIYTNTPNTPTVKVNSNKNYSNRYSFCNSYQVITPVSSNNLRPQPQYESNSSNHALKPVDLNVLIIENESPSPKFIERSKNKNYMNTTPNSIENAPPKPPRRISLLP